MDSLFNSLGTTQITQDVFEAFIEAMGEKYNINTYDLFNNNCNNFTNDASQFLTGKPIPARKIYHFDFFYIF